MYWLLLIPAALIGGLIGTVLLGLVPAIVISVLLGQFPSGPGVLFDILPRVGCAIGIIIGLTLVTAVKP